MSVADGCGRWEPRPLWARASRLRAVRSKCRASALATKRPRVVAYPESRAGATAAGVILYELVTGGVPFGGDTIAVLVLKIIAAPAPPLRNHRPDEPDGPEEVILRPLAGAVRPQEPRQDRQGFARRDDDLRSVRLLAVDAVEHEQVLEEGPCHLAAALSPPSPGFVYPLPRRHRLPPSAVWEANRAGRRSSVVFLGSRAQYGGAVPIPAVPPTLLKALKDARAVAIVGSGLSSASGAPSWDKLIEAVAGEAESLCPKERTRVKKARALLGKGNYLDSAGMLKDVLGEQFYPTVARRVGRHLRPNASHAILVQLPFRAIVTTNFDILLEDAMPQGASWPVYPWFDDDLPWHVRNMDRLLLKLHGDIDHPKKIVLAREDYDGPIYSGKTRSALEALFVTCHPFFIGYGHRDPDLDLLVDKLGAQAGLSGGFALVTGKDTARDRRIEKAKMFAIHVDCHDDVPTFLAQLAREVGVEVKGLPGPATPPSAGSTAAAPAASAPRGAAPPAAPSERALDVTVRLDLAQEVIAST